MLAHVTLSGYPKLAELEVWFFSETKFSSSSTDCP
jgi:hypothetical protein